MCALRDSAGALMSGRPVVALMAAALSLVGTRAEAASVFDLFEDLCLATRAEPAAALAKAEGLGWTKAPPKLVRTLTKPSEPGEVVTGAAGRAARDLHGMLAVVVARTSWMVPRRELPADTCSVVAGPSVDMAAVARDVERFAATPAQRGLAFQKNAIGYLWRDLDGRRESLSPEQLAADPFSGEVTMLVVMQLRGVVVLQLFVPAREEI